MIILANPMAKAGHITDKNSAKNEADVIMLASGTTIRFAKTEITEMP